ncbi:hypothetical protein HNP38_003261 [Chryseobacterium defluvii]|uniref:Uncharacterized protein n=1 Tax=Chryseobacterium defluvii TaxID=160396 RepID=A0A840KGY5_9FLAO|nr:hypothetical protein [Chryseobacterium defluvii]MBB4807945.1 hypothetical protein [Chryseobacterium defluvii]
MIKKIIIPVIVMISMNVRSQVAIGKSDITNISVSLEFGDDENKGMVLPYVTDKSGIVENGTIIYDATDFKVKYLKDTDTWFDLSVDPTGTADLSIQGNDKTEQPGAKVSIVSTGNPDNTTKGILVLADEDKAMILPKVASPHLNIINPSAGMLVYDTDNKMLAVYNGKVWTFWKP